jgi:hypothetical protein
MEIIRTFVRQTNKNTTTMITTENREMHIKMIRSIENIITLQSNVNAGCEADEDELEKQLARIPAMKEWANTNGTIKDVLAWISDRPSAWGLDSRSFIATEMYKTFAA